MDQVTPDGTATAPERPAWIAQLPDDLKGNETFTSFKTIGDLAKTHLETVGKVKELDGITAKNKEYEAKLANAIFKPGENAKPEEISAYRKAIGMPDAPEGYEFPKRENDSEDMIKFGKKLAFELELPPEKAAKMVNIWNAYADGMVEAEDKLEKDEMEANQKKFREQFKSEEEFKAGYELAKRFWNKLTNTNFDDAYKDPEAWRVPLIMGFIFNAAKSTGEPLSPKGGGGGSPEKPGLKYDKTPKE